MRLVSDDTERIGIDYHKSVSDKEVTISFILVRQVSVVDGRTIEVGLVVASNSS